MGTTTILWAGKALSGQEEARLRRLTHALRRAGKHELAQDFERFLPEREDDWTQADISTGSRVGPSLAVQAGVAAPRDDERESA